MKNVGHVIKLERIKKNMKQITLAQGICTPSYLSKIENNSIAPSKEVADLLLVRLELTISQNKSLDDESYLSHIRKVYFEAIMNKDHKLAKEKLIEIQENRYLFNDISNYYTFQLMILRLLLIVQDINNDAGKLIKALSDLAPNFNEYQSFLFHTNVGAFHSFKNDHAASLDSYENAIEYFQNITVEKWENADFYYLLAHCYLIHQRWVISVEYIQTALEFFKNGFYNSRVVECYLILSIAQDKSHNTDEAFDNLILAQKISTQLNLTEQIPVISQSLGTLVSSRGDHEKAIEYFMDSLGFCTENIQKLIPIFSLIKEYSKLGQAQLVVKWATLGYEILQKEQNTSLTTYSHHFTVYKSRYSGYLEFEKITIDAIQFFKNIKDYRYAQKYSLFLAEYYNENTKYKNAAKYYALSNEYMFMKQKINFWEDL
jgi:transcriptional regulator with XRE-family HTH domain